jgi:hypothetical protein
VQRLTSPDLGEAVLTKLRAGTVLQPSEEGGLILGYNCADISTLAALTEISTTQGLPTALTEPTQRAMTALGEEGSRCP